MTIAIVGAGPAGLMAAYAASVLNESCNILLFDKNPTPGKKLIRTGSGKGNIGNEAQGSEFFHGNHPGAAMDAIAKMPLREMIGVLKKTGIYPAVKNGYIYPASFQAKAVRDAFSLYIEENKNIRFLGSKEIKYVRQKDGGFVLGVDGWEYEADKVILCCGGMSTPDTGSDGGGYEICRSLGHSITPVFPALVPLSVKKDVITEASGDRVSARVSYGEHSSEGELQITDYGISGIVVFQISRYVSGDLMNDVSPKVDICFMPEISDDELKNELLSRTGRVNKALLLGLLPEKLSAVMLKKAGLKPGGISDEESALKLMDIIRDYKVQIKGTRGFERSQVTAGGVDTDEVDPVTFESRLVSGLFICGELLDIDGDCGGYNLQWAFTSGYLAGKAACDD